jgi:hypothetical protein
MPSGNTKGEPIHSLEQVKVPPGFPDVLKNFTKFILEKQPTDLIQASTEYA